MSKRAVMKRPLGSLMRSMFFGVRPPHRNRPVRIKHTQREKWTREVSVKEVHYTAAIVFQRNYEEKKKRNNEEKKEKMNEENELPPYGNHFNAATPASAP